MEQPDIRFQFEQSPSQELTSEGSATVMWHSWRAWVSLAAGIILLGASAYSFYHIYIRPDPGPKGALLSNPAFIVYCLILGVYSLARLFILPESRARKYMKRLEAVYKDPAGLTITYCFKDDGYHSRTSDGAVINSAYDQILAVYETPHGIILQRKMHLFESLDKSRIQGGTLPEFKSFLQEKIPAAKFRWKS